MIQAPVEFLTHGREPDRELHRLIALRGPLSTRAIQKRTRIGYDVVRVSLKRLERYGLAASVVVPTGQHRAQLWSASYCPRRAAHPYFISAMTILRTRHRKQAA